MTKKGEKSPTSGKLENQKLKTYLILQILQQKTDEDHLMDAEGIIDELAELGIDAERRSIYRDIQAINEACWLLERLHEGDKVDIYKAHEAIENDADDEEKIICYKKLTKDNKGYYVKQRRYSPEEIRLLAESVYTAKFLSAKESDRLANVLCDFVSEHQARTIKHDAYVTDRIKTDNKNVLNYITTIDDAMATRLDGEKHEPEKISFQYLGYSLSDLKLTPKRKGQVYVVSPYKLLVVDGNYYLLACIGSKKMLTFRVDRMKGVKRTGKPREGQEVFAAIDLKNYGKRVFGMFHGDETRISICCDKGLLDTMIERFGTGSGVVYTKTDEEHFTVSAIVGISNQFFGWLLGFGDQAKITAPQSVVDDFAAYLARIRKMYCPNAACPLSFPKEQ